MTNLDAYLAIQELEEKLRLKGDVLSSQYTGILATLKIFQEKINDDKEFAKRDFILQLKIEAEKLVESGYLLPEPSIEEKAELAAMIAEAAEKRPEDEVVITLTELQHSNPQVLLFMLQSKIEFEKLIVTKEDRQQLREELNLEIPMPANYGTN